MPSAPESILKPELQSGKTPVADVQEPLEQPKVPKTIKELEAEEPLLQENPHRFVLFPLKYHEIVRGNLETPFMLHQSPFHNHTSRLTR